MMDGSLKEDGSTPADYDYNVAHHRHGDPDGALMSACRSRANSAVSASLETGMGDKEDGHGAEGVLSKEMLLTDPDQATRFVRETKVDALAVAIGHPTAPISFRESRPATCLR